ncbi:uncharacterized protein LOC142498689 isoform X3 [Ascaphus truei]|uniref:uncharacterized protein LOC142498689 isoform X3 n=1 Tax=Ascaphus truei TaxID=8439 RepID=UPI003F592679
MTTVTDVDVSPHGKGDAEGAGGMKMQEEQARGTEGKATPVQWGEFHGMRLGESWSDDNVGRPSQMKTVSRHGWMMKERRLHRTMGSGGVKIALCCLALQSISETNLEKVFESCFPSFPLPEIQEDVKPLEQFFPELGSWEDQTHTRSAERLWGTVCDRRIYPELQGKWEGSRLHSSYLSTLHISPNGKLHPHKVKSVVVSPAPKEKLQPHKLSVVVGKEPELKLMKVAAVSVHVSGFSPSHHLQSLFQHWTHPNGKTRLKVAYDFNRSLLV